MRVLFIFTCFALLVSCVPMKKYNDLVAKEQACTSELEQFKRAALDNENLANDLKARSTRLQQEVDQLKRDTAALGANYRLLQLSTQKLQAENGALEDAFDKLRNAGAKETANLQAELEAKNLELQHKSDALDALEKDLKTKELLLAEREQRVNELEELLKRKDEATALLKAKVANALRGFENKGLTVVQRDGKIYVSMEAKLLFASGSTTVELEGKKLLIELAKVLELEKDLEIIVEGHTDSDKLTSPIHPKSNWELSVLRSTAVIDILLVNSKMNPAQLMAAGRSEFHPVDPADKAKNRRIEIIISPNLNELFELIKND